MTPHLLPACDRSDDCVCDTHLECETCGDTGGVSVPVNGWTLDVPCPDCDLGDAA